MPKESNNLGQLGEKKAAEYLENIGYKILDRNYQNSFGRRLGEIDIVAFDKKEGELVFVEVKTREYEKYGQTLPEENITPGKLHKLAKIAESYLRKNGKDYESYRFDAISVWLKKDKSAEIKHIISL